MSGGSVKFFSSVFILYQNKIHLIYTDFMSKHSDGMKKPNKTRRWEEIWKLEGLYCHSVSILKNFFRFILAMLGFLVHGIWKPKDHPRDAARMRGCNQKVSKILK